MSSRLSPCANVHVDHRKWDAAQHWQMLGTYLGADEWGRWIGVSAHTRVHRPDAEFLSPVDHVQLWPTEHPWKASFYDRRSSDEVQVYVDITTPAAWHVDEAPVRLSLVDLDLDVVRCGETTYIDDEDEFAERWFAVLRELAGG